MNIEQQLLSPTQAAKYLNVSRMTIYRWIEQGKLNPVRLATIYLHIEDLDILKNNLKPAGG